MEEYIDTAFLISVPLIYGVLRWRRIGVSKLFTPTTCAEHLLFVLGMVAIYGALARDVYFSAEHRWFHPVSGCVLLILAWKRTMFELLLRRARGA